MEAATRGDLHIAYLHRFLFGSEAHARFYVACIARGFEHLHNHDVLYHDLKLENVVLDSHGYGKLCDFGRSTFVHPTDKKAYTVCGTPEYMASEAVTHRCQSQ